MAVSEDFVGWMAATVEEWADKWGVGPDRAFPAWALNFLFEIPEDDAYNQTDTLSQGDAGLDGWYYDRETQVFHLIQAKYSSNIATSTVDPGSLDSLGKALHLLSEPTVVAEGPHKDKLTTVAMQLGDAILNGAAISLDYFIAGKISANAVTELETAASNFNPPCTVEVYDTARFAEIKMAEDLIEDLNGIEVVFRLANADASFSLDSVLLSGTGVEYAAVASVDGRSVADAVDRWQSRLFHGNVRYYLRRVNKVNKQMLGTLSDPALINSFWLYNNGLTVVADSFIIETDNDEPRIVATNPQIVNGAQTSSVLRERRAHLNPGDVSLQCRFIAVADSDDGRKALTKISEFTNTQSPVKIADLKSNDPRHREMQKNFEMLPKPVFYERRRGEWQSLDSASRQLFQNRRVNKESIGQHFLAYLGKPAVAISSKAEIFEDLESEAFDTSISAQVYMLADELFGQADHLMKASSEEELLAMVPSLGNSSISGDPAAPSQIAALRRARSIVCAHCTALACEVFKWRYTSIGKARAEILRERIADPSSQTYRQVWTLVFKALRGWYFALPDKASLKTVLQRPATFDDMNGFLQDELASADRDGFPTI